MAIAHNDTLATSEPKWGSVDKTTLPRSAHADHGEARKKSTWKFPHHWVTGGVVNEVGVYGSGTMYLHRGGLNAAWSAAMGGRSGRRASASVVSHLSSHRSALGLKASDEVNVGGSSADKSSVREGEGRDEAMADATKQVGATPLDAEGDGQDRTINKNATYKKKFGEATLSSVSKATRKFPNGYVEGYASQFNVVDLQGDVVRPGAFTKSITERGPNGKIPFMVKHFGAGGDILDAVGVVSELKEDSYGLWFRAEFYGDKRSQEVRAKMEQLLGSKVTVGSSIGYRVLEWSYINDEENSRRVTELKELALVEITGTLKPANQGALLVAAKDFEGVDKQIAALEASLSFDPSSMSPEERGRVMDERFGDHEKAEGVRGRLEALCAKIDGLSRAEPENAEGKVVGTGEGSSPDVDAKPKVDRHSIVEDIALAHERRLNVLRRTRL